MWRAPRRDRTSHRRQRARGLLAAAGLALVLGLAAAGCGQPGAQAGHTPQPGGRVTYALPPNSAPNYIFPFTPAQYFTAVNSDFLQLLLYRPLYWYDVRSGGEILPNSGLSLASPPAYRGQVVTIRLKPGYRWSDGERVTAAGVLFWMHMMQANRTHWGGYVPGAFPDNVTSIQASGTYVVTMVIKGTFSPAWFTDNELSQITPLPKAWDVTATGPSDCTDQVRDCAAVFKYLDSQALNTTGYASSKIWAVVDGPWRLTGLSPGGALTFELNRQYSGRLPKYHIDRFQEVPFTSEQAEYNVLQAGGAQRLDVGYLPTVDAPVPPAGAGVGPNPVPGYQLQPVYAWGLNYFVYNFSNTTGQAPIFRQLYFRQAFQLLVNQAATIEGPLHGYGKASVGPVGDYPQTAYLSPQARRGDPFSYNPVRAARLLQDNGWTVVPSGTTTCTNPGTGPGQCGAGIRRGAPLRFSLLYATGVDWVGSAVKQIQSNDAQVGIRLNLDGEPIDSVLRKASTCTGTVTPKVSCPWQLADWGGGWSYVPDYLPTGEELFQTGSQANTGNYTDPHNDQLIQATLQNPSFSLSPMYAWQDYLAGQLPVVLQPNAPAQLIESINGLHIGTQSPTLAITPEAWYYTQ